MFDDLPQADLRWLCDVSSDARSRVAPRFPGARWTQSFDDLLNDDTLDAVAIATPSPTHADLVDQALRADKHVFVEKPLALDRSTTERLVSLADARGRRLMVGHVLLFHPAVRRLKELLEAGELGELFYLYCNRQNLGRVRHDENALWSLGAHDVSVLLHLLDDEPIEVSARGDSYVQEGIADVVFCHLRFATGITAHLHLSWLDPHKMRRITAVGSKRMAVIDDMETERKLTIYEKSATARSMDSFGEYVNVSFGDIVSPRLPNDEPLRLECEHFIATVRSENGTWTARNGAATVAVLDSLQRSIDRGGVPLAFTPGSMMQTARPEPPLGAVRPLRRAAHRN
jgi:predicted dehydrogenase